MQDANDYHHSAAPLAERCLVPSRWRAKGVALTAALKAPTGTQSVAVFAVANHGRWIAECPTCHDAQLTSATDPRYMCVECGNVGVGGVWRPVVWPANYREIGDLLDKRPLELANTLPGETLNQITAENVELFGVGQ